MPLFELYNSMMEEEARRAAQVKSMAISPEPFSTPEDEFGELIWSNGPRKKLLQPTEPDRASPYAGGRVQEIEDGTGVMTKSAEVVPLMAADELKRSVQVGLSAQAGEARDDMDVPWITCDPMEEGFPREIPQDDYCAEFLKEFSAGFALNSSTFRPSAERSGDSEHGRAPKAGAAVLGACGRPLEFSHQHGLLNTSLIVPEHYKPRRNAGTGRRPQQLQQRERRVGPISPRGAPSSPGAPSGGGGRLINFSHFMRPFALGKACPEGDRAAGGKLPSGQESTSGSKPLESTLVESGSGFKCTRETPPPVMAEAKPAAKPPHQEAAVVNVDRSDAFCREDYPNTKNNDKAKGANYAPDLDMPSSSSFAASFALSRHEKRRISEAAEASSSSSSSSSGNSHGQASTGHYKRRGKRKHREEAEESDRSGHFRRSDPKEHARHRGTKKHVYQRSAGTKRGRAAEVHNISERRRRDRINDRMRALQELIPNCNKVVDKASMLQEAIEYTKSLQFQLQMMSMGSGTLCMPQTVARGMQQFRLPTVTPFPAMGMGLGFGMGVHDMISGCSGPMFPIPPLLPQQFGCANSLAGTQAGLPALMPRLPLDALLALSTKASMVSGTPRTGAPSTQHADPTTTAVTSDDKRGKDLHAEAVEKPN